ncbi:MAG: hypothetical protein AUJ75_00150 [Candidatus Omnitrophica bacterium CG1_02_49_10]|nr:MAG: hypothetical protein AUJ75_00150 [Candidatus Omnitrophica bacterium CG1_02_49_10]
MSQNKPKRIFVAATRQNDGKTTVSLGLIFALKKRFKNVGFIKPVGQRYVIEKGEKVDEDSVLVERICGLDCRIKDMSPIAIERGFTQRYISGAKNGKLERRIMESFERCSKGKDLIIIEGTGHAGVGSVFDLSNATVARMLDAPVILVAGGGIGRPIDEVILNKALFDAEGAKIMGVIVNKAREDRLKKVEKFVRKVLGRKGIYLLGVIPYQPLLSRATIKQILDETDSELLAGERGLDNVIGNVLVGAMAAHDALKYITNNSLVITPGDREDIILTAMSRHLVGKKKGIKIAGIVLSGGIMPNSSILELVKETDIPILFTSDDTYRITSRIHDLTVKIRPEDKEKAKAVSLLLEKYVDLDRIVAAI